MAEMVKVFAGSANSIDPECDEEWTLMQEVSLYNWTNSESERNEVAEEFTEQYHGELEYQMEAQVLVKAKGEITKHIVRVEMYPSADASLVPGW